MAEDNEKITFDAELASQSNMSPLKPATLLGGDEDRDVIENLNQINSGNNSV